MVQEEKNDDDPGGKYVLRHDEISDKRPEVHGYRQLRGRLKKILIPDWKSLKRGKPGSRFARRKKCENADAIIITWLGAPAAVTR